MRGSRALRENYARLREWVPDQSVIRLASYDVVFVDHDVASRGSNPSILFTFGNTTSLRDEAARDAIAHADYRTLKAPGMLRIAAAGEIGVRGEFSNMKDSDVKIVYAQTTALVQQAKGRYLQLAAIVQGEYALQMIEGTDPRVILRDAVKHAVQRLVATLPQIPRNRVLSGVSLNCEVGRFHLMGNPEWSLYWRDHPKMDASATKPWDMGTEPYRIARVMPEILGWFVQAQAILNGVRRAAR